MNALTLFTAMCNNEVYCPLLSKDNLQRLKMVWENEPFGLIVWLHPYLDQISYTTSKYKVMSSIITIDSDAAKPLIEYWATHINQNEPKRKKAWNSL